MTRIIDYQMFSILLLDPSGSVLQHRFSLRFKESVQLKHEIPLGEAWWATPPSMSRPVLVPDVSKDPRYIEANPETRSELCIPLIYKDKVIGVLDIEHTRRGYFNEDHVRTMTTLAAQVAIAIENATLYERIARQEKRLEQDLALARELQFRLLPQKLPVFKHAEVAARFAPARQIGGDLYDFLQVQRPRRDRHRGRRRQRQGCSGGDLRRAGQRHCALACRGGAERRATCWRRSTCRCRSGRSKASTSL